MCRYPDRAVECFAHGLAHLIADHGYREGLERAGHVVLFLIDEGVPEGPLPAGDRNRSVSAHVATRRLTQARPGKRTGPTVGARPSPTTPSAGARVGPGNWEFDRGAVGQSKRNDQGGRMPDVTASVEVDVPVDVAYNQWTQFEEFPRFMEGVEEVRQLDDATLSWRAKIAGVERSWEARITEQEPDRVVAWSSTGGAKNSGRVAFQPVEGARTRIDLTLDMEPEGVAESAAEALGVVERRAEGDLERFKKFIEERGRETGSWRGEIHGGQVESGDRPSTGRADLGEAGTAKSSGLGEPDEPAIPTTDEPGIGEPRGEATDAFAPPAPHYADEEVLAEDEDRPGAGEQRRR